MYCELTVLMIKFTIMAGQCRQEFISLYLLADLWYMVYIYILIPVEHLWCDFKWARNSSPNTNYLYIHYMDKSIGTPSLEEKKALTNCANKDINVLKNCISISVTPVLKCMKWLSPYVQVISVWWWVCGSFKVTPEVFSCFLQTSQVLPHWLNHHFSLILVLYTETLSC